MKVIKGKTVVCELVVRCTNPDNDCDRKHHRYVCEDGTTYGRASFISCMTKRRRVTTLYNIFSNSTSETATENIKFFLGRGYTKV